MLVAEALKRKDDIKQKIVELEFYLGKVGGAPAPGKDAVGLYGEVINSIFKLFDKYQNLSILIERSNLSNEVEIGKSKLSVSNAVKLRRTVSEKIRVLTDVIGNGDPMINVPNLIDQRDKLIEEHILLDNVIKQSDWGVEID